MYFIHCSFIQLIFSLKTQSVRRSGHSMRSRWYVKMLNFACFWDTPTFGTPQSDLNLRSPCLCLLTTESTTHHHTEPVRGYWVYWIQKDHCHMTSLARSSPTDSEHCSWDSCSVSFSAVRDSRDSHLCQLGFSAGTEVVGWICLKGSLSDWLTRYDLHSPTMSIFTLERLTHNTLWMSSYGCEHPRVCYTVSLFPFGRETHLEITNSTLHCVLISVKTKGINFILLP